MIKVSVIVPVYNVEVHLDKCIQSIVGQTLSELEVILVDDGSKDKSPEICDDWAKKDNRIRVIHKQNEGQSVARNVGMSYATGEYIAFVDSDDFIEPNTYEVMYGECTTRNLDVAYFTYDRVNGNGEIISRNKIAHTELFDGKERVMELMLNLVGRIPSEYHLHHYTTSASMSLYKANIIRDYNITFPNVREIASEDLLFSLLFLPYANGAGCFPYVFYHYFVNAGSTTTSYSDAKYHRMERCLEEVKSICEKHFSQETYMPHFLSQILRIYKIAMRYEIIANDLPNIKKQKLISYCKSPWMQFVYKNPALRKYPFRDRLYIFCMKHQILSFFSYIYKWKLI